MFRFLTFSSLQPSLKRSSGESTIFFTSLPFSRMVQKILPSMLHTLCVDGSWRRIRAILARRGVRSSLIYTPFLLPASRNLRLFFMMVVLVFRRTNLTMIGRVLPGRPGSRWLTLMSSAFNDDLINCEHIVEQKLSCS